MRYLLIIFLLLAQLCNAQETLHPLDGPQDADVDFLERDSAGILYAWTRGGFLFFRSEDNGENWKRIDPKGRIHSLALDRDGNLYLALSTAQGLTSPIYGLLHSNDRGNSWTALKGGVPDARIVSVGPDGSIYFATHNRLTRRKAGETGWTAVDIIPHSLSDTANQIQSLAYHPDGDLFAGTPVGVYRTTDNGLTWSRASTGLADAAIRDLKLVGGDLYAGSESTLWRSTDKGASWGRVDVAGHQPVALAASSPERVMVGTRDGKLYRSSDRGTTWQATITPDLFYLALLRAREGLLVAGSVLYGTWLSNDDGDTWRRSVRGMNSATVVTLAISPNGTMFAGVQGRYTGMFYTSTDGGSNWIGRQSTPAPGQSWCSAALPNGDALMGTEGTGIYRSADNGITWTQQNTGLTNLIIRSIAVKSNGDVLAGTEGKGIFLSKDNGQTWSATSLKTRQVWAIAIHPDGTIIVGLENGTIRYSEDDGATWKDSAPTGIASDIQSFAIAPDKSIYAATFQDGVFRSTDAGRTWTATSYNRRVLFAAAALPSGDVFIGGSRGIVRSKDNGVTWDTVGGSFSSWTHWLTVDSSGNLYAAAGAIYRLQKPSQVVVDRRDAERGMQIAIHPNPVSAGSTIRIALERAGETRVRIYDMAGALQGTFDAGEAGEILWPVGLAPGIYYCVIDRDGAVVSSGKVEVR